LWPKRGVISVVCDFIVGFFTNRISAIFDETGRLQWHCQPGEELNFHKNKGNTRLLREKNWYSHLGVIVVNRAVIGYLRESAQLGDESAHRYSYIGKGRVVWCDYGNALCPPNGHVSQRSNP
jgi:hypothetical protein